MKSHRVLGMIAVAITVILTAALAMPAVQAVGYEKVHLYGYQVSAAGQSADACSYAVTVENPGVVSLEDDYLNMTVYVEPTGTGASHMTMYVHVYLNDGTTNVSLGNKSLAAVDDATVWSNLSYHDPLMSAFVVNGTARLTTTLWFLNTTPNPDDFQCVDTYVSTFGIYTTAVGAAIGAFIPLIITVAIFAAIIPMFRKIGGKKR
jgi:hypothetical protein